MNIALFPNEAKEPGSNEPDWRGWNSNTGDSVVGWNKIADNKDKTRYISLKIETSEDKRQRLAEIKEQLAP